MKAGAPKIAFKRKWPMERSQPPHRISLSSVMGRSRTRLPVAW